MLKKTILALLWVSMLATAATTPNFILGLDYSQWLSTSVRSISTDASGAIYILGAERVPGVSPLLAVVTKLSADGKSIVWQNHLPIEAIQMVVNPGGEVFVLPIRQDGALSVVKLNPAGSGLAWTSLVLLPAPVQNSPVLAADVNGRAYLGSEGKMVRLTADGSSVEYSVDLGGGIPYSIAADATGAAFVGEGIGNRSFLARFAPDGSAGFKVSVPASQTHVFLDANGNAVVDAAGTLIRFDANGNVISSLSEGTPITANLAYGLFGLDEAGNAYVWGSSNGGYYPVKNTIATCVTQFLSVLAPDGSVLQTTYLPGAEPVYGTPMLTMGKDGTVLAIVTSKQGVTMSRPGPYPAPPAGSPPATALLSLSPAATADTFPLACVSNAATYATGPITAGELVSVYGNGMGPLQGVQPNATLQTPYPAQVADVQVTFNGTPAPILYAQDGQVNVVVPWSLDKTRNAEVCVTYGGAALKCLSWPTAEGSPGVFREYGSIIAVALNQDGSVNSVTNPAARGSIVSVFANGLGTVTPQPVDGSLINLPLATNVVAATVDGFVPGIVRSSQTAVPTEVTYYGPAPFRVAGISQINFRLMNAATSYRVGLTGVFSQTFWIYTATQ